MEKKTENLDIGSEEEWKKIDGCGIRSETEQVDYYISNKGNLKTVKSKVNAPRKSYHLYMEDGKLINKTVAKLVYEAFVEPLSEGDNVYRMDSAKPFTPDNLVCITQRGKSRVGYKSFKILALDSNSNIIAEYKNCLEATNKTSNTYDNIRKSFLNGIPASDGLYYVKKEITE